MRVSLIIKITSTAKSQKVPPYVVFYDKALVKMVKINPMSIDEMSKITEIGEVKIKRYGQVFLDILLDWSNAI